MFGTTVETRPWLYCDAPLSVQQTEDWLSYFDLSDLQASPLTQEADDIAQVLDFDVLDLLLPEIDPPNLSDAFSPIVETDPDGVMQESIGFSSVIEPNGSMYHQISSEGTTMAEPDHVGIVYQEPADAHSLPVKSHSSTVSSPHDSDAGSSLAVREGVFFNKENCADNCRNVSSDKSVKDSKNHSVASSSKRHHEDTGSDLDGGDKEGLQPDSSNKRQQRLLRNRELAFESRQRKKCYVSDLEAKCRAIEQERNQLQQQLCFASAENAVLQKEVSRLKSMKGKDGVAEPAVLFKDSPPLEFLSLLICLLLTALLSLCGSPFLALALRTTQSPAKVGGLAEEQGASKRYFICMSFVVRLDRLGYHTPLVDRGRKTRGQAPHPLMEQNSCYTMRV